MTSRSSSPFQAGNSDGVDSEVLLVRQRVAIARAMANEPPLLLADEPTGNLDSNTGLEVMGVLHDLRKRTGAALVLVTHNKEICKGCDRMLRMLDGRVEE